MTARPLSHRLARASLITTVIALLLTAGSLFLYELTTNRSALEADARAQAELIAKTTSAALVFDDKKVARDNLNLLRLKPSVQAAAIYRASGQFFAAYSRQDVANAVLPRDLALEAQETRLTGQVVDVAYPIWSDGEVVGQVYLRAEHALWRQATVYAGILALVVLFILPISFFVFNRLQRHITAPLDAVTEVAEQVVVKRDWSLRAPAMDDSSAGVLVRAFNEMLSEVQQRTGELERSNQALERSNALLERESSERRHAEDELKRQDRRKDEFIATLAHELRNPLAPMMNATALLRSPASTGSIRDRAATIIDRQLKHMARLIEDLLDVSRIMTGKLSLLRELVDVRTVLTSATEATESLFGHRHQQIRVDVTSHPCKVVGDAARLTQVFSNLLNNASRYTPEGGLVEVSVLAEEDAAVVRVRDNGVGVEPAMQERIFELFEQADKSLERGSAGLGIGLTLARQLTQLHGGTLSMQSEGLGRGSCFTVRLPMSSQSAEPQHVAEARAAAPHQTLSVLVADDNVDYAQSLAVILETQGHRVRVVHDGTAAIVAVSESKPDVALLDIGMPGLNGYDVARKLRQRYSSSSLRLIAITGWGQAAALEQASVAGFDVHLVKPVDVEDIVAALSPEQP